MTNCKFLRIWKKSSTLNRSMVEPHRIASIKRAGSAPTVEDALPLTEPLHSGISARTAHKLSKDGGR